mmetsp:Transcript_13982/g.22022  ORF Transcript_13982/g.22022 Transcript_13982/m.22022 type:complete len:154 (-) Transcript_13982:29-490(-)
MKVLLFAFFLFVSSVLSCDDVASGPYTCAFGDDSDVAVFVDLANNEITVDYPGNACNYFGTVFEHDGDLIVTNVKCFDATDCSVNVKYDCLPYTIENIEFVDEEACTSFDGNNEETDAPVSCFANFQRVSSSSPASAIVPFVGLIIAAFFTLA